MLSPAAILLAFANDWVDDKRHLRSLLDESKAISKAIAPLVEAGLLGLPPPLHNATVDDVIEAFRARRHRGQIRIFHFAGHAGSSTLLFEDDAGHLLQAHARGLAGFLGRQPGLVLVFLNGCCTEPQVRQMRAAGIKAVVATTRAIQDEVAAAFAAAFYAELATRSLRDAFDTAVQVVQLRWGDSRRSVTRDLDPHEDGDPGWPWIIDCDPTYEAWKLGSEPSGEAGRTARSGFRRAGRTWRVPLLLAASTMLLLLTSTLALSAQARRTTCRAPGLRSLCAMAGFGDLPSPAEQALWKQALAQSSGDGLRMYLRMYPTGTYVDDVDSRLKRCWTEHVEALTPETQRLYWVVNPVRARPFPTEDGARDDALARGHQDAVRICPSIGNVELLSVSVEPHDWKCSKQDRGFACGFDGTVVCRVQYRTQVEREHCNALE